MRTFRRLLPLAVLLIACFALLGLAREVAEPAAYEPDAGGPWIMGGR